ncbi:hypothetical protein ACFX2I_013616 [Malus domestica]
MVFSSVVGEKSSGDGMAELELLFVDQRRSGLSWRSTYSGCAHHVQQAGFGGVRQQRAAQIPVDLEMSWRA